MVLVAPATPWGHAALAVVRLTGAGLDEVLDRICAPLRPGPWRPGRTRRVLVRDEDGVFDDGVVVVQRGPRSYTGEDTAELTVHGNPRIVERVLDAAVAAGARLASPGAFTRRAWENGKLDLVRAEGVLQASHARSPAGLDIARAGLDGRLGEALASRREALLSATAELEAWLDHPDDELALLDDASLVDDLVEIAASLRSLAGTWRAGHVLVDGARVALVGAVKAGKSSLFNALLGRQRALVHDTPGTTRDVLEVATMLEGVPVTLLDTAGERDTDDPVEAAGLALARDLVAEADLLVVVVRPGPDGLDPKARAILDRTADRRRIVVQSGIDETARRIDGAVHASSATGEGLDRVRAAMRSALVGETPGHAGLLVASAHQRDALLAAARDVDTAVEALPVAGPAVAADALTQAIESLDDLTGADTREEVLDALFSRFCIGK